MSVYLDCAATTPIDPRVLEAVVHHMETEFGNAGSRTHEYGTRARRAVERARDQVAAVVDATRREVYFTSGATESNNLAILGLAEHGLKTKRTHIVSTQIEHNAVLEPLQELERRGFTLTLIPPTPGGWVDPDAIASALRPETLLVSFMQVNNETGIIQPIEQICTRLASHDAYLHVDAAQGFGKELEPLRNKRIDLISVSGHKLHAPKGVGALIARRRSGGERPPLTPLQFGGGQERGLRPGTQSVPLIAGLGLAAELAVNESADRAAYNRAFRHRALDALNVLDPILTGNQSRVVPHILNLSFPGIDAESAMEAMAEFVAVSNGSACTSGATVCSHVLGSMGLSADQSEGAIRLSWSHMTPDPDWPRVVAAIRNLRIATRC